MPFKIKEKLLDRADNTENKGLTWLLIVVVLLAMSLAILYLNKEADSNNSAGATISRTPSRLPRTYTVFYGGGVFSPTNLRIHSGDTVQFENDGGAAIWVISDPHSEHTGLSSLNSGNIPSKGVFSYTFSLPGIFGYHNEKDPNETGTIIVR